MEIVLSWVKSGLLFGIFASVILMLSPSKSYQKHIGMVVGMLFILVMVHPILSWFQLDEQTYTSYIRNFLRLESVQGEADTISIYEDAVEMQLLANLQNGGYAVKDVKCEASEDGNVERVSLLVEEGISGMEKLELYLKNMFGEEVRIQYEME